MRYRSFAFCLLLSLAVALGAPQRAAAQAYPGSGPGGGGGGFGGGGPGGGSPGGGGGGHGGGGVGEDTQSSAARAAVPLDPFMMAMTAKQKGDLPKAMQMLKALSERGAGYEVAQFELGKIYYERAAKLADTAAAQAERTHGFGWILHAAAGGLGTAEAKLVQICLDGDGTPPSRIEAAKWFLLWRQNPSRMQLGTSQFDPNIERRLRASTVETDWTEAQRRAVAFIRS